MKHLYLVESEEELSRYQHFVSRHQPRLNEYIIWLKQNFAVHELPNVILWTSGLTATSRISNIPIPAYTNDFRTVMTSDLDTWRNIYFSQLDGLDDCDAVHKIRSYYSKKLNHNHILQILGHELAHHSALFLEDFNSELSDGIWFEEGMVEYISRRFFLTAEEFDAEAEINQLIVDLLAPRYGNHSLEQFGTSTYEGDYASIFFEYWRSFLAVKRIIEENDHNIHAVFQSYHEWNQAGTRQTLTQWFDVDG